MASDSEGLRLEPAHIDWPLARPIVANGFRFGRVTTFPGTGIPRPGFRRKWLPIRKGYDFRGGVPHFHYESQMASDSEGLRPALPAGGVIFLF